MKTLYVHMGAPKTGSSFLQSLLTRNRDLLRAQGLVYPLCGFLDNELGTAQHFISFYLEGSKPDWVHKNLLTLDELQNELLNEDISDQNVIISSESFFGIPQSENSYKLRSLFPDYKIEFILYLRTPVSFAKSWYSQIVKNFPFYQDTFDNFANHFAYNFEEIVSNYVADFGKDNMHIFSYESVVSGSSLESHFAKLVGLKMTDEFTYDTTENVSPKQSDIELFRFLNTYATDDLPSRLRNFIYKELSQHFEKSNEQIFQYIDLCGKGLMSFETRNELYEMIARYRDQTNHVNNTFSSEALSKINEKYEVPFQSLIKKYECY